MSLGTVQNLSRTALDLRKFIPQGIIDQDNDGVFTSFLEVFSEIYDDLKSEAEETLKALDLSRCPGEYLPFIGKFLGAEVLRLNLFENTDMESDYDGDGLVDGWTSTIAIESIVLRRVSHAQRLEGDSGNFYQAITMDLSLKYVMSAKIRVVSGSVRIGDVDDDNKTIAISYDDNKAVWQTYRFMHTPNDGSQNYGLKIDEAGTVVEIDDVYVASHTKEILVRDWLRNVSAEYRRKGCLTGLESVILLLTGCAVNSWSEQLLPYYLLNYNHLGSEYIWFGPEGAPDPALGNPGDPSIYSREWNSLNGANDMVVRYFDVGIITNGFFDSPIDDWTVASGSAKWGAEKVRWGKNSVKLTGTTISFYQDPVSKTASKRYVIIAWVNIPDSADFTTLPRIVIEPAGGGGAVATGDEASAYKDGQWQEIKVVIPDSYAGTSIRVEIEAAASPSASFYLDAIQGSQRKWTEIELNSPGGPLEAEVQDLLEGILPNYLPVGLEFDITFV